MFPHVVTKMKIGIIVVSNIIKNKIILVEENIIIIDTFIMMYINTYTSLILLFFLISLKIAVVTTIDNNIKTVLIFLIFIISLIIVFSFFVKIIIRTVDIDKRGVIMVRIICT